MEIREYARAVLLAEELSVKLAPPSGLVTDDAPHGDVPSRPGRPPRLAIETDSKRKKRVPRIEGMRDPAQRVRIVHALANHELQAVELFAFALLRFPDADSSFRRGLLRILTEEQDHCRRYIERIESMGEKFGDYPVSGYFWSKADEIVSPLHFVCSMCLTFENANLDHAVDLAAAARQWGDDATAEVLDIVHRDEVGHVRFGWSWLAAWKRDDQTMAEAWQAHIPWPLRPALARGENFYRESRELVGFDEEFIGMLEESSRPRDLYKFAPPRDRSQPSP